MSGKTIDHNVARLTLYKVVCYLSIITALIVSCSVIKIKVRKARNEIYKTQNEKADSVVNKSR